MTSLEDRSTDMTSTPPPPGPTPGPSRHHLAVMIWLCVFPTLTALNFALGDWLATMSTVVRTFVLVSIAVPIVIYALMPQLHRARARLWTPARR
jgi:antibiotic biosynthesis monooxygenase (ABM) superfamily enzyme